VSISRAIAGRSGQHVDGNQEFIGQGLSNLVGAFFSGYASSGSFNRSGVNCAAGAKTPLAVVYASFFLLGILLLVAPLAAYLPTAAMAGILFLVAWGLIDFHHIRQLHRISRQETVCTGRGAALAVKGVQALQLPIHPDMRGSEAISVLVVEDNKNWRPTSPITLSREAIWWIWPWTASPACIWR